MKVVGARLQILPHHERLGREDPVEEGNGNPLQCSGLENPMDRGAWRTIVHGVTKRRN